MTEFAKICLTFLIALAISTFTITRLDREKYEWFFTTFGLYMAIVCMASAITLLTIWIWK